jgi:microcin C transport system substrate-binding protein
MAWKTSGILMMAAGALVAGTFFLPATTLAQDWTHGIATLGDLKYPAGFAHFDYVNPDAPKAGNLRLSELGTFDTLNPLLNKGNLATGLGLVYESLMKRSLDEPFSNYGLIAESMSYPEDYSSVSFRLNPKARWADGQPITVDDVIFSFNAAKDYDQSKYFYYQHVTGAKATGASEVTFTFDLKDNHELPNIVGELLILPKHWWEATGPDGKKRDISATTLEPVMGSGPYRLTAINPGATLRFELRDDYWGKDLNVNIGYNNFKTIDYTYFSDRNVEFEAFKANGFDYWDENEAKRWATQYDFPAVKDGRIVREQLPNDYRSSGASAS